MNKQHDISSVLTENRVFAPSKKFAAKAIVSSAKNLDKIRKAAEKNPVAFWEQCAAALQWDKKWKSALIWNYPFAQWFAGGKINASVNCLDRHLSSYRKNKAAIIWEGEPGDQRTLTYGQLHAEVCRAANVLKKFGIGKGDTVAIYMGMIPEAVIAMLACARIGAVHNVVFGGFSSDALRDRMLDMKAKLLVTQDGAFRRGTSVNLKDAADKAVAECPDITSVIVVRRSGENIQMCAGRDYWWGEVMKSATAINKPESLSAEHPLFALYTSGSTGKPKGILHTTGGYLTQVNFTSRIIFDLNDDDIYFCTADIGWVTGHSYVVYGPLSNGATVFMYEGAPNFPDAGRFWDMIERHRITILYTAPTAIRAFMKWGDSYVLKHDLSSLRLLGSVGEPINPEAWMWYRAVVGKNNCPIVDTWWQTETGAIMIAPIPGVVPTKPGSGTLPLPGIIADAVRRDGTSCEQNEGGYLVIKHPWPAMLRTIVGDDERYRKTYWSEFPPNENGEGGWYFTGDGARRDKDGYFWIIGRVDDVVNVSGHRLGTAEIESALVSHTTVAEAAVITRPDEIKGNALVAFVTLKSGADVPALHELREILRNHVAKEIGHIAKPDEIRFSEQLPKTRSGKIMRRLLREIVAEGKTSGDTTALEDFSVLEKLRATEEE
ncbi:acetate--CoA ligase [Ignavibacteria bacterium]|nr:acetate--CoA ligase [Bacteroidota bacterium]MCZ2132453.1 acetate--CoA ligase [Bacteroidota bacterium]